MQPPSNSYATFLAEFWVQKLRITSKKQAKNRMPRADTQFRPGQSGNPGGRPKGSQNKSTKLRNELLGPILPSAIEQLNDAVSEGERWAVELVVTYCLPKPKPVDPEELEEFEHRLAQLEEAANQ